MIWMKGTSLKIKNKVLKSFLFTSESKEKNGLQVREEKNQIRFV